MCKECGCGFQDYKDLETGAPGKPAPKQGK